MMDNFRFGKKDQVHSGEEVRELGRPLSVRAQVNSSLTRWRLHRREKTAKRALCESNDVLNKVQG